MSEHPLEQRLRCPVCLALFRTAFDRCPADGAGLVPAVGDPLIGSAIDGRHVLDQLVGEGSMGLIYRARHQHLPRSFAVKILFGDLIADPRMRIRFAQEAALASRLSHRNVVSVHDFGRSERGLLYLVMDYIEGEPLSAFIAREAPLPALRAIQLTRQLAQGLGYAHENGLVHRDFKPGNVMLERLEDGAIVPRILDFGLAISTRERDEMPGRLTEFGFIVGTPIYMAPEQALDRPVDHRADLFALGVVMYEMLAGKPPFDGRPVEIAHKNVSLIPPRISQRSPGVAVSPDLERIVRCLLEKSPDDRFQSAEELCAALDAVERAALERKTQGLTSSLRQPVEILPRDELVGADEFDDGLDLDWPARTRRPRRRFAAAGALLFAAGALVYGLAERTGLFHVASLEPPAVGAAVAASQPPDPEPRHGPGAQPPTRAGAALVAVTPVEPEQPAQPHQVARPAAPRHAHAPPHRRRDRSTASARARAAEQRLARAEAEAFVAVEESDDEAGTIDLSAEPEQATTEPTAPAPEAQPEDGADGNAGITAEAPAAEEAGAAGEPAPSAPDPADAEPSVERLIRDYREIGEAIAMLEARQGEKVARSFRERYFRIPYGDALRIPALRRDTLAALAELRHDVMAAMDQVTADTASVPAG